MRRALPALLLVAALAGCGGAGWTAGSGSGSSPPQAEAEANVRSVIPALEAYYADHGTYAGATLARLRADYDASLDGMTIVRADASTYCVESTVGDAVFNKGGPGAEIAPGPC